MKKATPFVTACFIAGMLYVGLSGCNKNDDDDCKTCKAFRPDNNQQVDEATVCSQTEENAFRSKNEARRIECN